MKKKNNPGIVFIVGGARSGKSRMAVETAKTFSKGKRRVTFVATARASDREMTDRIRRHRESRPRKWNTVEAPMDVATAIAAGKKDAVLIVDCLGLLLSNWLLDGRTDARIEKDIGLLVENARKSPARLIVVSNEVGCGIVPVNKLARRFRDLLGLANQKFALAAQTVLAMNTGIPVPLKGKIPHAG